MILEMGILGFFKKILPFVLLLVIMIAIPAAIYGLMQLGVLQKQTEPQNTTQQTTIVPTKTIPTFPSPTPFHSSSMITLPPRISPTPLSEVNSTVTLSLTMPGIGPNENTKPLHASQSADLFLYAVTDNQLVKKITDGVSFNGVSFTGIFQLGTLAPGSYYMKVKLPNTLLKLTPGVQTVTDNKNYELPKVALIPGDLNQDNTITMDDATIFLACYGDKTCEQKNLADLNDDGKVDGVDYNILLRSFTTKAGD